MKHAATPSSATTTTKDNHHSAFNAMYAESNLPQSTQKRQPPGKQPFSSGASRGLIPPSSGRRSSVSPTKVTRPAPASSSSTAGPQSRQTSSSSATPVPTISGGGRVLPQSSAGTGGRRVDVATSATRVSAAAFLSKAGVTNASSAAATAASSSSSALTGGQNSANNGPANAVVSAGMQSSTIGSAARRSSSSSAITPRKSTVSSSSSSSSVAPSSTLRSSSAQRATRPSTPTAMRTSSSALNNSTHTVSHNNNNNNNNAVSTSRSTTPSKLPKRQQHSKALAEQQFVTDDQGNRYVIKGTQAYFQQIHRASQGETAYLYETDEIDYDDVYAGFKNSPKFMDNSLYRPRNQSLEDVKKELEKEAQNLSTSTAAAASDISSAALPSATTDENLQKGKESVRALTPPLTPLTTSAGAAPIENVASATESKKISSSPMFEDEPSRAYIDGNEFDMTKESLMSPILFSTRNNAHAHGQANAAKDSLAFDSPARSAGSSPSTNRRAHVHFDEEEEDFLADPATPLRTHTNTQKTLPKAISSSAPSAATARLLNMSVEEWIWEDEEKDEELRDTSAIEHDTSVHIGESVGMNKSLSLEDLFADLRLAPPVRSQQPQQSKAQLTHTSGNTVHSHPSQDHHNYNALHIPDVSAHNGSPHKSVSSVDQNKDYDYHSKPQSPEKIQLSAPPSSQENPALRTSFPPPFVALNPALSSSPVTSKPHSLTHHDYHVNSSPARESANTISSISPQKELPKFAISVSSSSSVDSIASSPTKGTENISVEVLKAQLQAALLRNDTLQGEMRTLVDAKRKEETQHILALTEANSKIQTLQQEMQALRANKSQIEADNKSFNAKIKEVSAQNITLNQLLTAQTVEFAELKTELELEKAKQKDEVVIPEQSILQPRPAVETVETEVQADVVDVRYLLQEVARLTELKMKLEQQVKSLNEQNLDLINQNMKMSELLMNTPTVVMTPAAESPLEKRRPAEEIHLPPPPTLTKSEIYVNEFVKKADMLQSSEKECKSIEVGLMDHFKKLAEEAVDCLVELESDKTMIEETFANINFNHLVPDDDVSGIRYRPSDVSFMFGSPSSRFPINISGKNSPSVRGKLGQSGMGSPAESQKKAASHKSSTDSSLHEPHHPSLEEQEIDDC